MGMRTAPHEPTAEEYVLLWKLTFSNDTKEDFLVPSIHELLSEATVDELYQAQRQKEKDERQQ